MHLPLWNHTKLKEVRSFTLYKIQQHLWQNLWFWLVLFAVCCLAIGYRLNIVNGFLVSYDEAIHLMWLRLLQAGYEPYREIYITYPPLYHLSLQAIWQLWPAETALRWFSIGYLIFGGIGTGLLARRIAGATAGLIAAALVLFSPVLLKPSREIMGELYAVAWATWAVFFMWLYRQPGQLKQKRLYLILSAFCLAVSLLMKLLMPFVALLIIWAIVQEHLAEIKGKPRRWRLFLQDLFWWGVATVTPVFIFLLLVYDTGSLFQQVINQRILARVVAADEVISLTILYPLFATFVREELFLVVAGSMGLVVAWRHFRHDAVVLTAWLAVVLLFLLVHTPLRNKHFLTLIPTLAVLASLMLVSSITWLKQRPRSWFRLGGLGLVLSLLFFWQVFTLQETVQDATTEPQPNRHEKEMLTFISTVTAPDDCVITDHTPLLYWSGRMTPPQLAEMSGNRLSSGATQPETLIKLSQRHNCQVVALAGHRLTKSMPVYVDWVRANYLGELIVDDMQIYFALADNNTNSQALTLANFANKISLQQYNMAQIAEAGSRLPLTLTWKAQTNLDDDYAIFVQMRDDSGVTVTSADYQAYGGLLPTSQWRVQQSLKTVTWLTLPEDMPTDSYQIYIGLYRPDTFERLPLQDDVSGENAFILAPIRVGSL